MRNYMDRIVKEFNDCGIEFYYDWTNMETYQVKLGENYELIKIVLEELVGKGRSGQIYFRLHGYKEWLIIRLIGEWDLLESKAEIIRQKCLKFNSEILVKISCKTRYFFISLSLYSLFIPENRNLSIFLEIIQWYKYN